MSGPVEPGRWGPPESSGQRDWAEPPRESSGAAPGSAVPPFPSGEQPAVYWGPPPAPDWAPPAAPASPVGSDRAASFPAPPVSAGDWAPPTGAPASGASRDPATDSTALGRSRRWLTVLATLTTCLALLIFTGGFQYARATYRYEQAPPGMAYSRDGATARVLSIVAAPKVRTGTSKDEVAPAGSVYVVARVQLSGDDPVMLCGGRLVLRDGRTFREAFLSKPESVSCSQVGKRPVTEVNLYYLVPEPAVGQIVGLAMEHRIGLARTTVIRPA